MNITEGRTHLITSALLQASRGYNVEWAESYGEPGYSDPEELILLADWNDIPDWIGEYLEQTGYTCEWSDEWTVDHGSHPVKAYRTQPDGYNWRPTAVLPPEWCEYATPDCDHGEIIEAYATDSAAMVSTVPYWITDDDFEEAGYVEHESDMVLGFHSGMDDDPIKIARYLLDDRKRAQQVVCRVRENSQFYARFSVWYLPVEELEECTE